MGHKSKESTECFKEYYDDSFLRHFRIVNESNVMFIIGKSENGKKFLVMTNNYNDSKPMRDYIGVFNVNGSPSESMALKIKRLEERHNIIYALYEQNPKIPVRMNPFAPVNWRDLKVLVRCMYLTFVYYQTTNRNFRGNKLFLVNYVDEEFPYFVYENRCLFAGFQEPKNAKYFEGCKNCQSTSRNYGCSEVKKWFEDTFEGLTDDKQDLPIFECFSKCSCFKKKEICKSRVSYHNRDNIPLVIFKTTQKGWALGAGKDMKAGELITEYVGVIFEHTQVRKNADATFAFDMDYMRLELEGKFGPNLKKTNGFYLLDSRRIGNESRFANHSCSPNMKIVVSYGVYKTPTFHKVFYVMKQDVPIGSELTVKYFHNPINDPNGKKLKCKCGSDNCMITLPISSYSHIGSITPIAKELSKNNINVTIISTNGYEYKNPNKTNFRILTNVVKSTKTRQYPSKEFLERSTNYMWFQYYSSLIIKDNFKNQVNSLGITFEENQKFINDIINQKWDYVLIDELITVFGNVIVQKLYENQNIRHGMFATARQWDLQSRARAMGQSYAGRPSFFGDGIENENDNDLTTLNYGFKILKEKIYEFVFIEWLFEKYARDFVDSLKFLNNEYSQYWIYKNADFSLRDYPDKIFYPTTTAVDVIEGGSHCIESKEEILNEETKKILDDPMVKNVIYMAFGGTVDFYNAPKNVINSFFEMFNYFNETTFIWSYKGPEIKNLPSNVNIFPWIQQGEVLKHLKTKLFISHGGLKSFKESLCNEVPMLFLPVFAEQFHNAISAKNYIGLPFINKFYINGSELKKLISKLLNNSSYHEKIKMTKLIMNDRIIPALQESTWKIKQFITKPYLTKFTKRSGIENSWYEYFYFYELLTFLITVFIIFKDN
uniref:glucuronosyltransferase n=1 Tax=Strongyloides stercoralis TaxID=6248 RepID=A0AAF5D9T5_STRER